MQSTSDLLDAQVNASSQTVVPRVEAEWLNSRYITGLAGFSSSDDYFQTTLDNDPVLYLPLNERRYSDLIVADAPISYWAFDEGSGTTATDTMGYINGAYIGAPSFGTSIFDSTKYNVTLNGSSQYVNITDDINEGYKFYPGRYAPGAFSVEGWINPSSVSSGSIFWRQLLYDLKISTTKLVLSGSYMAATPSWTETGTTVLTTSTWYHIVIAYNGRSVKVFLNGKLEIVKAFTGSEKGIDCSLLSANYNAGSFTAYKTYIGFNSTNYFSGIIDDFAYYDYELSTTQVYNHYMTGSGVAQDYSNNGTNGAYQTSKSPRGTNVNPINIIPPVYDTCAQTQGVSVSTLVWEHTIAAYNNRAFVVGLSIENASTLTATITYDGVAMTRFTSAAQDLNEAGTHIQTELYYLLEEDLPPAGVYPVVVTLSGSATGVVGGSISVYNVYQAAPTIYNSNSTSSDGTTNTLTLTANETYGMYIDVVGGGTGSTSLTATGDNTERIDLASTQNILGMSTSIGSTTVTSKTHSWTSALSQARWAQSGIAFSPAQKTHEVCPIFTGGASLSEYIPVSIAADPTDNFVLEVWGYLSAHPGNGIRNVIASKASGTTAATTQYGIDFIGTGASTTQLQGYVGTNQAGGTRYTVNSSADITLKQWYHAVLVMKSGTIYFYVNGVLQGSSATSGSLNVVGSFSVGRSGSSANNYLNGRASHIAFYETVVMYSNQVTPRYYSGICSSYYSQGFSTVDEVFNNKRGYNFVWANTDMYDENSELITFNGIYNVSESLLEEKTHKFAYGWQSNDISDSSGNFGTTQYLTTHFDSVTCTSIMIAFPTTYGGPKSYTLYYRDGSGAWTQVGSTWQTEAGQRFIDHPLYASTAVTGVELRIVSTNVPYDRVRIIGIIPRIFEDISTDVVNIKLNKVKENFDSSVPFGVTGANDVEIVVQNTELKYNPNNSSSTIYGYMDQDIPFDVALGWEDAGGATGLSIPGSGYVSTPDKTHLSATGDLDIRIKVALADYSPSSEQTLISKWLSTTSQKSFVFDLQTDGKLQFTYSTDGITDVAKKSTVAVSTISTLVDGGTIWFRVVHDVDNGAAGNDVKFYYSSNGTSWTQLGATVTTAGIVTRFDSTTSILIGASEGGV